MLLKELDIELPEINEIVLEDVNSPLFVWNGYDLANMMGMTGKLTADVNYEIDYGSDVSSFHKFIDYNIRIHLIYCL